MLAIGLFSMGGRWGTLISPYYKLAWEEANSDMEKKVDIGREKYII